MGGRKANWRRMGATAKLRRGELGLSQDELIESMPDHRRIGIETLRRIEAGDRATYRPTTLAAVSEALGWPADRLWEEAHSDHPGPSTDARLKSLEERLGRVEQTLAELVEDEDG